jgi:hypothetical protein
MTGLIALAACAEQADRDPPPAKEPDAALPGPTARWSLQASATSGSALVRFDETGAEVFRLACRRAPDGLYAEAPAVMRIGSEDRLTLGAGDQLAVLVVSMEGPDQGLRAEGALQAEFIEALAAGRPLALSYGARQAAFGTVPSDTGSAFARACTAPGPAAPP